MYGEIMILKFLSLQLMRLITLKFGGNVQDHDLNRHYKIQVAMGNILICA